MPDLLPEDELETRVDLTEAVLGIGLAVLVAPSVIWWGGIAIGVVNTTLEAFR